MANDSQQTPDRGQPQRQWDSEQPREYVRPGVPGQAGGEAGGAGDGGDGNAGQGSGQPGRQQGGSSQGGAQQGGQAGGGQTQGGQDGKGAQSKKRSKGFMIVLIVLVIVGAWFGISKWIHAKHHEETDDAQISANISPIIPRVSGYIADVRVRDNQPVKKGDTLIILDDRDLRLKLEQAEAALGTAESNLEQARATTSASRSNIQAQQVSVATVGAQIDAAKVTLWRATQDYERYSNLIKDHSITQQQYEQALAAKQSAEQQVRVLENQQQQAMEQTHYVSKQSNATSTQIKIAEATIQQRKVDVDDAKLNLSYAVITAPANGQVSKVNAQAGQYATAGSSLFSLVLDSSLWVVANFKETQLDRIRIGQRVLISVDAYPHHEFEGEVGSFSPATGAQFALLPPDNSSGNFVKVVQRLPVKILFTQNGDSLLQGLRAGMNVNVDVHLNGK
jgi:membrane fusion protein (multidrug efflux system)